MTSQETQGNILAALILAVPRGSGHWRDRQPFQAFKLFTGGRFEQVDEANFDTAIEFVRKRRYQPFGFWIHGGPAIAFSVGANTVAQAWRKAHDDDPIMAAPLAFHKRDWWETKRDRSGYVGTSVIVVGNWVIAPTRTGAEIARLRGQYPGYAGDLALVPLCVIRREHDERREREIRAGGRGALAWANAGG
jgi:hypothetical protein